MDVLATGDPVARQMAEGVQAALDDFKGETRGAFEELRKELREWRTSYAGRPSWGITVALGGLLSVTATLLTLLLQRVAQ